MDYLSKHIQAGQLRLACPGCGGDAFSESGLGGDLLHCNKCFTHTRLHEWVTLLKRVGDDDPHVALLIERKGGEVTVCVDTSKRSSEHTESVRFCVHPGGGRSLATQESLRQAALRFKRTSKVSARFRGRGGTLTIMEGGGDPDMWVKTQNIDPEEGEESFHGATVTFQTNGDGFAEILPGLISALLKDMEKRPILP